MVSTCQSTPLDPFASTGGITPQDSTESRRNLDEDLVAAVLCVMAGQVYEVSLPVPSSGVSVPTDTSLP